MQPPLLSAIFFLIPRQGAWPVFVLLIFLFFHGIGLALNFRDHSRQLLSWIFWVSTVLVVSAVPLFPAWVFLTAGGAIVAALWNRKILEHSRMWLAITILVFASIRIESFILFGRSSRTLSESAIEVKNWFDSSLTTFPAQDVLDIACWFLIRTGLGLALVIALTRKASASWRVEPYRIKFLSPFPRARLERGQRRDSFILRAFMPLAIIFVVAVNRGLSITETSIRLAISCINKIIDLITKTAVWVCFRIVELAKAGAKGLIDACQFSGMSLLSICLPFAFTALFSQLTLNISQNTVQYVVGNSRFFPIVLQTIGLMAVSLVALLIGGWLVAPVDTIQLWYTHKMQLLSDPASGLLSKIAMQNLRSIGGSVTNYVESFWTTLFLSYSVILFFADMVGSFGHIGPYRFGAPFIFCAVIYLLGGTVFFWRARGSDNTGRLKHDALVPTEKK
ncbi:MAG TPA: hypothetical protein VGQ12_19700 [Candidatus Angelobacter sp.]|nr:hypothetical protein [Candidatus Angelobacter sp.]